MLPPPRYLVLSAMTRLTTTIVVLVGIAAALLVRCANEGCDAAQTDKTCIACASR